MVPPFVGLVCRTTKFTGILWGCQVTWHKIQIVGWWANSAGWCVCVVVLQWGGRNFLWRKLKPEMHLEFIMSHTQHSLPASHSSWWQSHRLWSNRPLGEWRFHPQSAPRHPPRHPVSLPALAGHRPWTSCPQDRGVSGVCVTNIWSITHRMFCFDFSKL